MHYLKKREMFTIHKPFFEKIKKKDNKATVTLY